MIIVINIIKKIGDNHITERIISAILFSLPQAPPRSWRWETRALQPTPTSASRPSWTPVSLLRTMKISPPRPRRTCLRPLSPMKHSRLPVLRQEALTPQGHSRPRPCHNPSSPVGLLPPTPRSCAQEETYRGRGASVMIQTLTPRWIREGRRWRRMETSS